MSRFQELQIILMFLFLVSACATDPRENPLPQLDCEQFQHLYVINHGIHTGIAIRRADLVEILPNLADHFQYGNYLEIGWGDARYYPAPNPTFSLGAQALLWSTPSVLHLVLIPESPLQSFQQLEILQIWVPKSGYLELLQYIKETFFFSADSEVIRLGEGLYWDSWFYQANGYFNVFNTCNRWVAGALQTAGFPISDRGIIRAESLLKRLRREMNSLNSRGISNDHCL